MSLEDWAKLILQSNAVAAVIVGIFGVVTLKMGIAKFASEKWWEKRAASFASVIEGLHGVHQFHESMAKSYEEGYTLSSTYKVKLDEACTTGFNEIRKGANIGSFVMSQRAASILRETLDKIEKVDDETDPLSFHSEMADIVGAAIAAMTKEAKENLRT